MMRSGRPSRALTLVAILGLAGLLATMVQAHTRWADGTPVPEWVRNACCGPSDIHHLRPEEVQITPEGYRIAGVRALVPFAKTLVSQDGEYWVFYRDFPDGTQYVFCFFAPQIGY